MGRYRKIDVRTWSDEKFEALSKPPPSAQVLWLYLLTGEGTSVIPGLYRAGEAALAEQLGWSLEDFRRCWAEVAGQKMAQADWKARLVWLPKAITYDPPANQNVVMSWATVWGEIPDCPLKAAAWESMARSMAARDAEPTRDGKPRETPFLKTFEESCPKPSSKPSPNRSPNGSPNRSGNDSPNGVPNPEPEPEPEPEQEPDRVEPPQAAAARLPGDRGAPESRLPEPPSPSALAPAAERVGELPALSMPPGRSGTDTPPPRGVQEGGTSDTERAWQAWRELFEFHVGRPTVVQLSPLDRQRLHEAVVAVGLDDLLDRMRRWHAERWAEGRRQLSVFLRQLDRLAETPKAPRPPPRSGDLLTPEQRRQEADFSAWLRSLPEARRGAYWDEREQVVAEAMKAGGDADAAIAALEQRYRQVVETTTNNRAKAGGG